MNFISIRVILTNAVKSWHFPLNEWHSQTSPLKSYVSNIKARTPFYKVVLDHVKFGPSADNFKLKQLKGKRIHTFSCCVTLSSWFEKVILGTPVWDGSPLMAKELWVAKYAYLLKGKELFCRKFVLHEHPNRKNDGSSFWCFPIVYVLDYHKAKEWVGVRLASQATTNVHMEKLS